MHLKSTVAILLTSALAISAAPVPEPCGDHSLPINVPTPTSTPIKTPSATPIPSKASSAIPSSIKTPTPYPTVIADPVPTYTPKPSSSVIPTSIKTPTPFPTVVADPIPTYTPKPSSTPAVPVALTMSGLMGIDAKTASCAGAPFPQECVNAERAAPAISASFTKYGLTSKGEQAAALAILLFESASFKYNKNHFPGRPGQGTYNMQMPNFNTEYAAAAGVSTAGTPAELVDRLNAKDELAFGSAAWYLSTKCSPAVRAALKTGSAEGWSQYLTVCVGTTQTEERNVIWRAALKGMGN